MYDKFQNAVVVITGGASGIGQALAQRFAALGSIVIVIDRQNEILQKTVAAFQAEGYDIHPEFVDMIHAEDVEAAFRRIIATHHKVDYMINNAGVFTGGEMRDTPLRDWHAIMQANVASVINGTYYAYQAMLSQGSGHIINTSSVAGLVPMPVLGVYGSSKYAITGLTHGLRNEAQELGIKVSLVCPTLVNTPLYDTAQYHRIDTESALSRRESFQSAEVAAERMIKGIASNRRTIQTSYVTQFMYWVYRASPRLYDRWARRAHRKFRSKLRIN